jgi:O-antigen biosynthesis protein
VKLSVIIVNYNVRAYLEQCLRTVFTALEGIEGEVFVVDNMSTDGSVEMVRTNFPQVKLIANRENVGFSRANNQAIRISSGKYVLLLNPDTVVGEDVFQRVVGFMDSRPAVGGLGVKMVDGTGRFLPESKRGLPTPRVAFFKIIGLTRLFPRSKVFGRYHLGHLPENEAAPIEILSGACMFLRKSTLDEVGLLDENFFMYGEDIDLSYRITLAGYENWYFPDARIIHYKGESTKKSSVNYVFVFYNAMAIFARKHFAQRGSGIFPKLINASIYLSAAAAIAVRFLDRALMPLLDLLTVLLVLAVTPLVPEYWPFLHELGTDLFIGAAVVGLMALFGGYDRPIRILRPVRTMGLLFLCTMAYAFAIGMAADVRLELAWTFLSTTLAFVLMRSGMHALRIQSSGLRRRERERVLAIGEPSSTRGALALLWQTHFGLGWTGSIHPDSPEARPDELATTIRSRGIGEVVFCAKDMPWRTIIAHLEHLRNSQAIFKIAQPGNDFIIGPSSIESLNDLYLLEEHALNGPMARRNKRILDVGCSLLLLAALPITALIVRSPRTLVANCMAVLKGERSWVGYHPGSSGDIPRLPTLPKGVIDPLVGMRSVSDPVAVARANIIYAKDYSAWRDIALLWRALRSLGGA